MNSTYDWTRYPPIRGKEKRHHNPTGGENRMKRRSILSLVALVLVFTMVMAGCGSKTGDADTPEQQIAALEQENELLRAQIETLTRQLESLQSAILTDWSLNALATSDRTAATITFTAVPASESEGQTLSRIVNLNGLEAESVPCTMDGSRYTATVELPAADGYSFYCLLTGPTGTTQQIPLITPDDPGDGSLVNLGSSLSAYCSLFVDKWDYSDGKLTLENAYVQAQMPIISTGGDNVTPSSATLVFLHNGQELERKELTLDAGEGEGSYEATISGLAFSTPKLEEDHQLDLELVITLSDGSSLSYDGCSWFVTDGSLNPVMG